MVKSCANKITSFLITNKTIKNEEYELYSYGFETLIAFILNIVVILFIGYTLNRLSETLLFLTLYCPIRQFAGGYHAANYKSCLMVFISIYITNVFLIETLSYKKLDVIFIVMTVISYIGVYFLAPLEHRNNPLSKKEKNLYKKIVRYLISGVLLISMIGINFKITYKYSIYLMSVILCTFIMLILGTTKKLRGMKI